METSALQQESTWASCIYFLPLTSLWVLWLTSGIAPANPMNEITLRHALLSGKCPSCREGAIFKYPFSHISHFADMHVNCPVCGAGFVPEPGFYFGAMYITYAFNVAILITFGLSLYYFAELPEAVYLILIALLAVAVTPASFRVSRVLWLYWFGGLSYKPRP
jgi:hypothetical protein